MSYAAERMVRHVAPDYPRDDDEITVTRERLCLMLATAMETGWTTRDSGEGPAAFDALRQRSADELGAVIRKSKAQKDETQA